MGATELLGTLPRHTSSDSIPSSDTKKSLSARKRSDIREEEVAQLLAEGQARVRSRETTPQAQRWRPASRQTTSLADMSILHSPSVSAQTRHRRDASADHHSPPLADWGEEYLHTFRRSTPSMRSYKPSISSPQLGNMARSATMEDSVLRNTRLARMPRSLSHTRNLTNALKQCRTTQLYHNSEGIASDILVQQLESAAELAELLNQGLRGLGRTVSQTSQSQEESLSADLHTLLMYSDEQVRHLTEALLAFMQEQRAKTHAQRASKLSSTDPSVYTSFSPATASSLKQSVAYSTQPWKESCISLSQQKTGSPPTNTLTTGSLWSAGRSMGQEPSFVSMDRSEHDKSTKKSPSLANLSLLSTVEGAASPPGPVP